MLAFKTEITTIILKNSQPQINNFRLYTSGRRASWSNRRTISVLAKWLPRGTRSPQVPVWTAFVGRSQCCRRRSPWLLTWWHDSPETPCTRSSSGSSQAARPDFTSSRPTAPKPHATIRVSKALSAASFGRFSARKIRISHKMCWWQQKRQELGRIRQSPTAKIGN